MATATVALYCPYRLALLAGLFVLGQAHVPADTAAAAEGQNAKSAEDQANSPARSGARSAPRTYMGRMIAPTMTYHGAGWLTRQEREREEQPAKLLKSLGLKPGQTVCDFGCGNGYYTLRLASLVGPRGEVFAIDIQPEMLELLQQRAKPRGLANIEPVLATSDDSGLAESQFDLVLMVDVYHELSDPPAVLAAVRRSLKRNGRLAVVEFREEDPDVPILPLHKMSKPQVHKELSANGLKLVGQFDQLPWQHVLLFARSDAELPRAELIPWTSSGR